jgi:glycosyltransferase involved in cell wall biosynthesis
MELKLAFLSTLPLDLAQSTGGVESVCINLLYGFRERDDVRIEWISFTRETSIYTVVQFSERIRIHYIPIRYRKSSLADFFLNRRELNRILKEFSPDIIHIQGASPHLLRLSGRSKKNIVVTQHGIMIAERTLVHGFTARLKFQFKYLVEKYYFPIFRNIVFISEYNKALFPLSDKHLYTLIRNPVNPHFFGLGGTLSPGEIRLIYIGWISHLKNLLLLLRALTQLREQGYSLKLTVVGKFKEPDYEKAVTEFISANGLDEQVCFTGPLSQDEVADQLAGSTVLVLPSRQENLPVSIAEAMAAGKIVVASNVGAISEMIEHGRTGFLFTSEDCGELTHILLNLARNAFSITHVSDAARQAAEQFRPDTVAEQSIAFYKRILVHNA